MTFHMATAWYLWLALAAVLLRYNTMFGNREDQVYLVLAAFVCLGLSVYGLAQYPWGVWVLLLLLAWGLWRLITAARATQWRPSRALTIRRRLHAVVTTPPAPQEPGDRDPLWGYVYTLAYIMVGIVALSVATLVAGR